MLQERETPPLWLPTERKCLYLLQQCQRHTKSSLFQIHAFMLRHAVETNIQTFTKFVVTLASVVGIGSARLVFDQRPHRDDAFLCNSMMKAHLGKRQFAESLALYNVLRRETDFAADNFTFMTLAKSCSMIMAVHEGLQLHSHVMKSGFSLDLYVSTGMVDMYAKFGKMKWARKVFDEMPQRSQVSWTTLICGYARCGEMELASKLFDEMSEIKDVVICNAMIDGHVKSGDMASARSLFDDMPEKNVISWTTMIYGYCNNSDILSARLLFDAMPERNLFSWNAMIGGYCQNRQPHEALRLFQEMQTTTLLEPDEVTVVSVLPAISDLGALDLGEWVHHFVQRKKLDRVINVCTSLLDMYAKCGRIEKAKRIFDEMPEKEVASWNAMINGYALNGLAHSALYLFMEMQKEGAKPNEVTMLGVLSACNHGGLVEEGKKWLHMMQNIGLNPKIEHYGCIVDLLGRAGLVEEAEDLIRIMPYEPNEVILSSFLSACGYSRDITRAERVLEKAANLEPQNHGNYVLLRNLYAAEKRWKDVEMMERLMRKEAKKEVGCSGIEVNSIISEFISGDTLHPCRRQIDLVLGQLLMHMKDRQAHKPD